MQTTYPHRYAKVCFYLMLAFALEENAVKKTAIHFLQDTAMSKVWFKQDDKFFLPKACLNFEFFRCVAIYELLHVNFDITKLGVGSWNVSKTFICMKCLCCFKIQNYAKKGGYLMVSQCCAIFKICYRFLRKVFSSENFFFLFFFE